MATKIDYAAVLADLEARRADIDAAIRAIKALVPDASAPKAPAQKRGRKPRAPKIDKSDLGTAWPEDSQNTSGDQHG